MTTAASSAVFTIDPAHSSVGFSVRHMMLSKVKGHFTGMRGEITLDADSDVPVRVSAEVDAHSIETREEQRNGHLKSADFLHADEFPKLSFVATDVSANGAAAFLLTGDLTIRGTTRSVTFEGEILGRTTDPWGNDRIAYEAKARIDRRDFGLIWNQALEAGGLLVGEQVEIELDIQAIRKK